MRRRIALFGAGLATLAGIGSLQAHHSGLMYDTTPIWIEGTVTGFEDINPHTLTMLEEQAADGQVRQWIVEGPGRSQFDRVLPGVVLPEAGDVIRFCGFPYKSSVELSTLFPEADFSLRRAREADASLPQVVAGHVMIGQDGNRRIWEPHGVIAECIQSGDDETEVWVDFLNANQRARRLWCEQRGYAHIRSTPSLEELVDEINGLIDNPCR